MILSEARDGVIGELATLAEVLAYLLSANTGLQADRVGVYRYVAYHVRRKHGTLESDPTIQTYKTDSLEPEEAKSLRQLRREIRRTVVRRARECELALPKSGLNFREEIDYDSSIL